MNIGKILSGWVGGLLAALAVVIAGLALWWVIIPPGVDEADETAQAPASGLAALPDAETDATPVQTPAETVQTPADTEPAPAEVADPAALQPLVPTFDVVRIKPDGNALVAGQAAPGAVISVIVEGAPVAEVQAGSGASFVAMFDLQPSQADRVMSLEARLDDGTRLTSETSVIIEGVARAAVVAEAPAPVPVPAPEPEPAAPPLPAAAATAEAPAGITTEAPAEATTAPAAEAATAPAAPEADVVAALEPSAQTPVTEAPAGAPAVDAEAAAAAPAAASEAPTPTPTPAPEPEAPRVLLAGPDGLKVVQDAGAPPQLSVDAIAYDSAGAIALSGRGQGQETLRVYVDNAAVGEITVGPQGEWRMPLPDIDAGVYTLRIDAISPAGEVNARVETPFVREHATVIAAASTQAAGAAAQGQRLAAVTVQPGHTLWAIAKGRYGEGESYWAIFDANRDQIRDPDWIYPGQVFTLPETAD